MTVDTNHKNLSEDERQYITQIAYELRAMQQEKTFVTLPSGDKITVYSSKDFVYGWK